MDYWEETHDFGFPKMEKQEMQNHEFLPNNPPLFDFLSLIFDPQSGNHEFLSNNPPLLNISNDLFEPFLTFWQFWEPVTGNNL